MKKHGLRIVKLIFLIHCSVFIGTSKGGVAVQASWSMDQPRYQTNLDRFSNKQPSNEPVYKHVERGQNESKQLRSS